MKLRRLASLIRDEKSKLIEKGLEEKRFMKDCVD